MFHICSQSSGISMRMSGQCFNDTQSSGWEWGLQPAIRECPAPARCPRPRTQRQWTQHFNKSPFSGANHSRKGCFVVGLERVRLVFLQWSVALPSPSSLQGFLKRPLISSLDQGCEGKSCMPECPQGPERQGAHYWLVAMLLDSLSLFFSTMKIVVRIKWLNGHVQGQA